MNTASYSVSPRIQWTVEIDGVLLFCPENELHHKLYYPEAAIWDFVSRNYDIPTMTRMIQPIGGLATSSEAAALVSDTLSSWVEEGWLHPKAGTPPHV